MLSFSSFLSRRGCSTPTARRFSSSFANSRFPRAFRDMRKRHTKYFLGGGWEPNVRRHFHQDHGPLWRGLGSDFEVPLTRIFRILCLSFNLRSLSLSAHAENFTGLLRAKTSGPGQEKTPLLGAQLNPRVALGAKIALLRVRFSLFFQGLFMSDRR